MILPSFPLRWVYRRRLSFLLYLVFFVVSRWANTLSRDKVGDKKVVSRQKRLSRHKVGDRKVVSRQKSCLETMSEAKKLSQDNAFVSDLVLRQHVCPSRDNQNGQRQQKRQQKITTQRAPSSPTLGIFIVTAQTRRKWSVDSGSTGGAISKTETSSINVKTKLKKKQKKQIILLQKTEIFWPKNQKSCTYTTLAPKVVYVHDFWFLSQNILFFF